jgi:hypothetical protein
MPTKCSRISKPDCQDDSAEPPPGKIAFGDYRLAQIGLPDRIVQDRVTATDEPFPSKPRFFPKINARREVVEHIAADVRAPKTKTNKTGSPNTEEHETTVVHVARPAEIYSLQ